MQRTCLVDRTCSDAASASAHFVHCRGAPPPPFPWNCHKGQHLASSLRTAQEHRLLKVLVPVSLGSLPAPARRAPRSLGDPGGIRTHLHSRARSKCARSWTGRREHAVGGGGAAAPGDARVCAPRGRLAGGAQLSRGLRGSGPGRGRGPHRALPPPGRTGRAGSRESKSSAPIARFSTSISSASSSFPQPPAQSQPVQTGQGAPQKRETGGKNTGNNFPGRRRARRWSPPEGPAPSLHVAAAATAAGLGGGRGRRLPGQPVAGRIAQYCGRGRGRGRAPG